MIHMEQGPGITRPIREPVEAAKPRRSVSWILTAFGFLVAGLVGGTIMFAWRPDWVWPFPVAGFIGYIIAFRRGLLLWNPNIDRTWRQYFWLERDAVSEDGQTADGRDVPSRAAEDLRVLRSEPSRRSRPDLRAVR